MCFETVHSLISSIDDNSKIVILNITFELHLSSAFFQLQCVQPAAKRPRVSGSAVVGVQVSYIFRTCDQLHLYCFRSFVAHHHNKRTYRSNVSNSIPFWNVLTGQILYGTALRWSYVLKKWWENRDGKAAFHGLLYELEQNLNWSP